MRYLGNDYPRPTAELTAAGTEGQTAKKPRSADASSVKSRWGAHPKFLIN